MGNKLTQPVMASAIADWCGATLKGVDIKVFRITTLVEPLDGSLCFSNEMPRLPIKTDTALIAPLNSENSAPGTLITPNPRLTFIRALNSLERNVGFEKSIDAPKVHPTAVVSQQAYLSPGSVVGARTVILPFAYIGENVKIGSDCIIKSGAVIGQDGFGFERDEQKCPVRMPHLGTVTIGDYVEIGALSTVCRGAIEDTVIGDHVKTDDHVHIAHNCYLAQGALLTACAELSGGVKIGEFSWIGPNASVMQKVSVGKNAVVGIAANVRKDVPEDAIVAGNPAKVLRTRGERG